MKERLDVLLVNKGFFESREKAKTSIMAGIVYVEGQKSDKAGNMIDTEANIEVRGDTCPYVSRGGLKLEKSINIWNLKLEGNTCMDIGSSTGGFTDCMLQNGASKVYALDVGTNQLVYKLRVDPRVVVMEKTNIREVDTSKIDPLDFVSIDISFISLKHAFPKAYEMLKDGGRVVALVKPQFEAGREQVGKNGIVRDKSVHKQVIQNVINLAEIEGFKPLGLTFSPVTGAKGNIEYLLYLIKDSENVNCDIDIEEVVNDSHNSLN